MKLLQAMFGKTSKRLDAVDVMRASHKLVRVVIDPIVLRIPGIYQSVHSSRKNSAASSPETLHTDHRSCPTALQ
jgi:hypothetical protein